MWLALVFYCVTPSVASCTLIANVNQLHLTEEECKTDSVAVANSLIANGAFARPACFKVGKGV